MTELNGVFWKKILLHINFPNHFVNLIMKYVSSVFFSFLVNGAPKCHLMPLRGLRQRDPLSYYLFLFYAEGLYTLISSSVNFGTLHRIRHLALALAFRICCLQMTVLFFPGLLRLILLRLKNYCRFMSVLRSTS